jgi:hypothetical protein
MLKEKQPTLIASRSKTKEDQSFSSESPSCVPSTLATDKRIFISLVNFGMNSRGTRNEARLNKSIKIL